MAHYRLLRACVQIIEGLTEKRQLQGLIGLLLIASGHLVVMALLIDEVVTREFWWGGPHADMGRLVIKHVNVTPRALVSKFIFSST